MLIVSLSRVIDGNTCFLQTPFTPVAFQPAPASAVSTKWRATRQPTISMLIFFSSRSKHSTAWEATMQFPFHLRFDCLPSSDQLFSIRFDILCESRAQQRYAQPRQRLPRCSAGRRTGAAGSFLCFCEQKKPLHDANWSVAQKHMSLSITDSHALPFSPRSPNCARQKPFCAAPKH